MKIYISGQITGLDFADACQQFAAAETMLTDAGHEPVNPITLAANADLTQTWEQFMLNDIKALFDCDAIYMLHTWRNSKGARCEHSIAEHIGKQIFYEDALLPTTSLIR